MNSIFLVITTLFYFSLGNPLVTLTQNHGSKPLKFLVLGRSDIVNAKLELDSPSEDNEIFTTINPPLYKQVELSDVDVVETVTDSQLQLQDESSDNDAVETVTDPKLQLQDALSDNDAVETVTDSSLQLQDALSVEDAVQTVTDSQLQLQQDLSDDDAVETVTDPQLQLQDALSVEDAVQTENEIQPQQLEQLKELNMTIFPSVSEFPAPNNTKLKPASIISNDTGKIHVEQFLGLRTGSTNAGLKGVNCQCGVERGRIINGQDTAIRELPWTAALVRNGFFGFGASRKPYCGGALVNNLYVVTATHCVDGMFPGGIKVWLNEEDYTSSETHRQEYLVDEIITHPEFDRRTVNNDIALVKLSKPVNIASPDSPIVPVCLPANNDADFAGLKGIVAGWGLTSQGGSQSHKLKSVELPIMTNEKCNSDATRYKGKISDNMMCAGFDEGGKDACQGDSGGPFVLPNGGRKTLIGIVSWGYGCAKPKSPGVYTRVGRYPEWILKNTEDALWCAQ